MKLSKPAVWGGGWGGREADGVIAFPARGQGLQTAQCEPCELRTPSRAFKLVYKCRVRNWTLKEPLMKLGLPFSGLREWHLGLVYTDWEKELFTFQIHICFWENQLQMVWRFHLETQPKKHSHPSVLTGTRQWCFHRCPRVTQGTKYHARDNCTQPRIVPPKMPMSWVK